MSLTGPSAFVVVGDTDWWSQSYRSVDIYTDSRLLAARRVENAGLVWRSVCGSSLKAATTARLYVELVYVAAETLSGLVASGSESAVLTTYPGGVAGSVGLYAAGRSIFHNALGTVQTNLSTFALGDSLCVIYYRDSSNVLKTRFLKNGRYNILGYSEDFGNAAWIKLNSATAVGKEITFVASNSYVQQNITEVGDTTAQVTFSALMSCATTQTIRVALLDANDGAPSYASNFVIGPTPIRCTLTATMGAGYSGALAVHILGNGVITAGSVVTVSECSVNGGLVADPYQVQTGAAGGFCGHPITLTEGSYRLATSLFTAGSETVLRADRDDQQYLPSDCQPWGAAARVADAGGYSSAATQWTAAGSSITIDAYKRTLESVSTTDIGICNGAPDLSAATGYYYFEVLQETKTGTYLSIGGLALRNSSTATAYPGQIAGSFGYYGQDGSKYQSTGSAAYGATWAVGDRIGVIWQPSTGKLWWSKNGVVQASGNPEAGTGAAFTTVTGDLVPAWSPYTGRVRLCTHAREQLYRPSYATAWDGADILPEQHYAGRLSRDTEITTGIWFAFPWGGSRRTGSPLGTIVFDNAGGKYDALRWYNLRDQELIVYEQVANQLNYVARVRCDSVTMDAETSVAITSRGLDCLMDIHIDEPAALFGQCNGLLPGTPISATQLIWDLAHTPYFVITSLLDVGVALTLGSGRFHSLPATAQGWRLGANPAGTLAASSSVMYRRSTQVSLTNASFTAWTADNPDGWTITETGPAALITQSGSAARFVRTGGAATLNMTQTIAPPSMTGNKLFALLNISAYTSGDLKVGLNGGAPTNVGINSTGLYIVPLSGTGSTLLEIKCDDAVTDITLADVEVWHCTGTTSRASIFEYLIKDYGRLADTQYNLGTPPSAYTNSANTSGFWTKDRPTVRQIIDRLCQSWLCDYYTSPAGVITFVTMEEPSGKTPTGTLIETDARGPMSVSDDLAPALTDGFLYDINFAPYSDSEIAGSVTAANRATYTADGVLYRWTPGYHPFYTHATGAPAQMLYLNGPATQNAIAPTLSGSYADRKWFFERDYVTVAVRGHHPGAYLTVKANRFGLTAGEVVMLVAKTRRLLSPVTRCKFWG